LPAKLKAWQIADPSPPPHPNTTTLSIVTLLIGSKVTSDRFMLESYLFNIFRTAPRGRNLIPLA